MFGKYVAYIGSYTRKNPNGLTICDVDEKNGFIKIRKQIKISNTSYIKINEAKGILYAIEDSGLRAYKIMPDGDLEEINSSTINAMRGCYIDVDDEGDYIYVAGYHDGKVTMLSLREDGGLGEITDEIYFKGTGRPYEENYRPHISCAVLTPFGRYLCVSDLSSDNYKVYKVDKTHGKLNQVYIIPCELDSNPRLIVFSKMGRYAYILGTNSKLIKSYTYDKISTGEKFTPIQNIEVRCKRMSNQAAPYSLITSNSGKFMVASVLDDNYVVFFDRNPENGLLSIDFSLPISGDFPKDIQLFPNDKFLASVNNDSEQVTVFRVDRDKKTMVMTQRPIDIEKPNCIRFYRLKGGNV